MKNNLIVFIVLIIVHICYPQNQFSAKKHAIIVGYNGINDSFTSDYLFFNKDSWNFNSAIYIGHVYALNDYLNLNTDITNNEYRAGQLVNGTVLTKSGNVSGVNVMLQYDISSINRDERALTFKFIKPFITVGLGVTMVDFDISAVAHNDKITFNYGFGGNFWLGSFYQDKCGCNNRNDFLYNLGFTSQIIGKSSFQQSINGNSIQVMGGLIYRL